MSVALYGKYTRALNFQNTLLAQVDEAFPFELDGSETFFVLSQDRDKKVC